jgi:tetratricopeptide (TPR) repeat protein
MKQIFLLIAASSVAAFAHCTAEEGQEFIDQGRYEQAVREFSCLIQSRPTSVEGYRGRIEARLLLGEYADALGDYSKVTAFVLPVHPNAAETIEAGYAARLKAKPNSIPALTGASFFQWWAFEYAKAIQLLNRLLNVEPRNRYGNLFRGSSRLLNGVAGQQGVADLERAIQLDSANPHVRFVVADAYTYGQPDADRAFAEARRALRWGLDTPRIHAILANAYREFGNEPAAAVETYIHMEQVTNRLVRTDPLPANTTRTLPLFPGRTYEIPVALATGQALSVGTSSEDFYDTILVVLDPQGRPVFSADDVEEYFAAIHWIAGTGGVYRIRVTSFESINTGALKVRRN